MSKYFSRANENKNREKTEIKIDGIKVKSEKKAMYFLLALEPLVLISSLSEFLISKNIIKKKWLIKKYWLLIKFEG